MLLLLIYLVFVGVGLPDSLLGSAWPLMSRSFGSPTDAAGLLSIGISLGIIVSSLIAYRLVHRFRFGGAAVIGLASMTAAIACYSLAKSYWFALACSFPLGFGSGILQTLFNEYVSQRYSAQHMNWLHGAWGIGAVAGPLIVAAHSAIPEGWRISYGVVALFEALLLAAIIWTRKKWSVESTPMPARKEPRRHPAKALRGKVWVVLQFFLYCSVENAMMLWGASFLTEAGGSTPGAAARGVSMFFAGITLGRFLGGVLAKRIRGGRMIALSVGGAAALDVALLLLCGTPAAPVLLLLLGCCMAPIYPELLHQTPGFFPEDDPQLLMGLQVASAYTGILVIPPVMGKLFSVLSFRMLPVIQMVFLIAMAGCVYTLQKRSGREKTAA